MEKCRRWIIASSRQFFTENNITRNMYIHMFPSLAWRKGTNKRISRSTESEFFSSTSEPRVGEKESACIEREANNSRKERKKIVDGQDAGEELSDFNPVNDELGESATYLPVYKSSVTGKMKLDEGTQIVFTKYMLSAKVKTMILKNEVSTMKEQKSKIVSSSSYEVIREDPDLMKHFVGLTASQFEVSFSFLIDV